MERFEGLGPAEFFAAAVREQDFPPQELPEIALVGRSNVGKSSFLNALTASRGAARTSRTPGRTRSVNFYRCGRVAFVDLPGYGYAKVSKEERNRWKDVIEGYLQRKQLKLVIQIVDARTGPTPLDQTMREWLLQRSLPTMVVVTKLDKLAKSAARAAVADAALKLAIAEELVLGFSAVTREGAKAVWKLAAVLAGVGGIASSRAGRPSSRSTSATPSPSRPIPTRRRSISRN